MAIVSPLVAAQREYLSEHGFVGGELVATVVVRAELDSATVWEHFLREVVFLVQGLLTIQGAEEYGSGQCPHVQNCSGHP